MKYILVLLALIAMNLGCTNIGQLETTIVAPEKGKSYYVIGLKSPNIRIGIFPGKIVEGKFEVDNYRGAVFFSNPINGYLVGQAKANDVLAITQVRLADSSTVLGPSYIPCDNAKTIVFKAHPGQVIYLGDVDFNFKGEGLTISVGNNIEAAKTYINTNFPNLNGRLEFQQSEFLPTTKECSQGTTYNPIYIYIPHR